MKRGSGKKRPMQNRLLSSFSPAGGPVWTVERATIDGFVVVAELRPQCGRLAVIAGDAGRVVPNPDLVAGPLNLALFDVPNILLPANQPALLLAASADGGWKSEPVDIEMGGQSISVSMARSKSVLGHALTRFEAAAGDLIDAENSVDIALVDEDQWLTSCDDNAIVAGENICVLGRELMQFGLATPLGGGRFRLSRLLRGRGGTEWACNDHAVGEAFCLIQPSTLRSVSMPNGAIGATLNASARDATSEPIQFAAESVRPPSPVNLMATCQADGGLIVTWTRRSRQGFAWVDEIDAPLGEGSEQYRVTIAGSEASAELLSDQQNLMLSADSLGTLGLGPAMIEVRQIGDFAASRPVQIQITIA